MKHRVLLFLTLMLSSCAHSTYQFKVDNDMADYHGKSIYYRSSLRSQYASQIRGALVKKFAQMGMRVATNAKDADLIGIFDIETFYPQTDSKYVNKQIISQDEVLFSSDEEASSMYFSGNANINVKSPQTCFTLNIGRNGTSKVLYTSTFCADQQMETEDFLPYVVDLYTKYATYLRINVGVRCNTRYSNVEFSEDNGEKTSPTEDITQSKDRMQCELMQDSEQEFLNTLMFYQE